MQYKYHLVSFKLCPFVQRSVITLLEKGTNYSIEYIDLANKPDWFMEISPLGKVPVLRVGDEAVLFESAVINEFIEETATGPTLHPKDPLSRAHNRAWIEAGSELLRRMHRMIAADDKEKAQKAATAIRALLSRFDWELKGPFFNGEAFSLVDAAVAPPLQRLTWCEELVPSLEIFCPDLAKVCDWRDRLLGRPAITNSTVPEIRELFAESLRKKARHGAWIGNQI